MLPDEPDASEEAEVLLSDVLEDADRTKKEIKDKAKVLRKSAREYLNSNVLDDFKDKFKKTKKVKDSHYDNYKKLEKSSNKRTTFDQLSIAATNFRNPPFTSKNVTMRIKTFSLITIV